MMADKETVSLMHMHSRNKVMMSSYSLIHVTHDNKFYPCCYHGYSFIVRRLTSDHLTSK